MDITKFEEKTKSKDPFVICDNYIKRPAGVYIFKKSIREKFNDSLRSMFDCIKKLENEETVEDFQYKTIEECINYLSRIIIEKQKNQELVEFIKAYIYLAHNVNQNTYEYEAVEKKIEYLQRYCNNSLTISETLSLLISTKNRLGRWKEWEPPSFRLSRHYYNLIKED